MCTCLVSPLCKDAYEHFRSKWSNSAHVSLVSRIASKDNKSLIVLELPYPLFSC